MDTQLESTNTVTLSLLYALIEDIQLIFHADDLTKPAANLLIAIPCDKIEDLFVELDVQKLLAFFITDLVLVAGLEIVRSVHYSEVKDGVETEEICVHVLKHLGHDSLKEVEHLMPAVRALLGHEAPLQIKSKINLADCYTTGHRLRTMPLKLCMFLNSLSDFEDVSHSTSGEL